MSQFENNLSEGSIFKKLLLFSLPFLLSNIVQSLYSVADMLIVGNFSGTASMSGVNIGGQVTFILTNFVLGLCMGGTVLIAQYLGGNRRDEMRRVVSTMLTGLLLAAAVITLVMVFARDAALRLISTPAESFSEASDYLLVTVLGLVFIFAYNAMSAIMRGMGDSTRPFIFVLISCVTNIGLDLLLVGPFHMGAIGAAIATVFSQALSVSLCVVYLRRHHFIFDFKPRSFHIDSVMLKRIFRVGLPSAVQNSVTSFSFLFVTALVNTIGGVTASAAVGAVGKFNGFAIMPAIAMSASISTMAAQNIGAGRWDRAFKSCKLGMLVAVSISVCIFVLAQCLPKEILSLFDRDPDMIADGIAYMRSFSFDYLIVPFMFCLNGLFVGAGHTSFSLLTGMISSLIVRVPASYVFGLVLNMGLRGVGIGAPLASAASLLLNVGFLISGRWRVNAVEKHAKAIEHD